MKSGKPEKEGKMIIPPPTPREKEELAPFLKPKDLPKKGNTGLTLLGTGRKTSSRFYEGVDVACKMGGKNYILTIRYHAPNHRRLFARFGSDITKWNGIVKVERKIHMGKEYIAVVD